MPISYPGGTVAEHTAVRAALGVFDVSHLGKLAITGPGAAGVRQPVLHRRPGQDRPGAGAVHAVLHGRGRRGRRPDRLPGRPGRGAGRAERGQRGAGGPAAAGGRAGRRRDHRPAPRAGRARRAGPAGAGGGRRPVLGTPLELDYMAFTDVGDDPGLPHRLHRRARLRAARPGRRRGPGCGTRCWRRPSRSAAGRPGWPPGTPCAPRWATRCTARTCSVDITPVQAGSGWAVGWTQARVLGTRRADRREGGRPGAAAARAARGRTRACRGRGWPCCATARRSASPRRARSPRR